MGIHQDLWNPISSKEYPTDEGKAKYKKRLRNCLKISYVSKGS
jgi:hypothetical protein